MFSPASSVLAQVKSGRLRALAVTTAARAQQLPDVPTLMESGVPGYDASLWWALLLPRSAASEVVDKLNADLGRLMAQPEVQEKLAGMGVVGAHSSSRELAEAIRTRTQQMAKVLRDAGVQPE